MLPACFSVVSRWKPPTQKRQSPRTSPTRGCQVLARTLEWYGAPETTLAQLADEGKLFLTDYRILDGVPAGTWDQGNRRKFLWAPLGLFAQLPAHGARPAGLMPIAVQCYQQHDPVEAPVFGPFDGSPTTCNPVTAPADCRPEQIESQ